MNNTCNFGDNVVCPSGEMCAGNQCCKDGSTCPSARNNFNLCPKGKTYDCTDHTIPLPENFSCPSMQCCEVGKQQQCCAQPDFAGSGRCQNLGQWCDDIYATQPYNCGRTNDGKIICDCQGGSLPPIIPDPDCCKKAGGSIRDGECIFDNMLMCAQALNCDIDPDPTSRTPPLSCTKQGKYDCAECQNQDLGTRCRIPGSGGIVGGCYQTQYPPDELWECLPAANNCKMTGFYDDCMYNGKCTKNRVCTEDPFFPSDCALEDNKDACCKRSFGNNAKWDNKGSLCRFPCRKFCSFYEQKGESFLNCEG